MIEAHGLCRRPRHCRVVDPSNGRIATDRAIPGKTCTRIAMKRTSIKLSRILLCSSHLELEADCARTALHQFNG